MAGNGPQHARAGSPRSRWGEISLQGLISPLFTHRYLELSEQLLARHPLQAPHRPVRIFPLAGPGRVGERVQVRISAVPARQHNDLTCGPTAVLLLNAAMDPELADWLEHGEIPELLPPEIRALEPHDLTEPDPARRLALAQDATHRLLTRRAIGPLPWPRALGTPPWTAARNVRVPGVRYAHRPIPVSNQGVQDRVMAMLIAATGNGVPVPIYSGGSLGQGLSSAVPRHVLLALPRTGSHLRLFDPATGTIQAVPPEELVGRTTPHPALGNWTHLAWTLIPLVGPNP